MEENFNVNENAIEEVEETKKKEFSLARELFEWVYTIVIALVIAFVIKGFLFDIVEVEGPSMEKTLIDGDRLIITKLGYEPKQGDIVILDSAYKNREEYYDKKAMSEDEEVTGWYRLKNYIGLPQEYKRKYYVKRVIATEGQTVDLKNGKVYVDGKLLNEPYYDGLTMVSASSVEFPLTVEEDHVFVMGDNRPRSLDSRDQRLGQVPEDAVIGASRFRIWPLTKWGITE